MTNTRANENNRRPVAKLFRLASLIIVVAAALGGSLNDAASAQTTGAKQDAQAQQPQPAQPQQAQPKAPARPGQPAGVPAPTAEASAAQKYFTDVELINQNGERMRLYSDVLKNRVVVVNAFFATCQGSCLPMNRNLEKLQATFKERMGKDLYIVSISVDPTVDTPQALKEYAKKLNAAPGRLFLTGKKENVDWALYKLGQYVEQREQHTNIFIIGNERTGLWKKAFGLAKPEELVKVVESVLDDKPAPASPATPGGK
ncbi:MAG TPA: SCO family protein [Pyrinomonadaceae bacterium]|nr:SCO family protein [Pyrinomonadaceae bacterium]